MGVCAKSDWDSWVPDVEIAREVPEATLLPGKWVFIHAVLRML